MKYNEFKENEIYCTRVSHIRCFKKHFPEVDSSKMVSFRVIATPNTESSDLKIDIDAFEGEKHLNPRAEQGYWYIEPWNFDDVYNSFSEISNLDPIEWRYFVEYTYEDFPDSHYYLEVSKQDWFANDLKKGNYILVSSSSKPYRLARILSAKTRIDPPYGITASSKYLLSNTRAATAIRKAMHDTRKAEAKTRYLEQTDSLVIETPAPISIDKPNEKVKEADVPAERYHALEYENERLKALVVEQALEISELKRSKN